MVLIRSSAIAAFSICLSLTSTSDLDTSGAMFASSKARPTQARTPGENLGFAGGVDATLCADSARPTFGALLENSRDVETLVNAVVWIRDRC